VFNKHGFEKFKKNQLKQPEITLKTLKKPACRLLQKNLGFGEPCFTIISFSSGHHLRLWKFGSRD